jgi:hypothetical protein
MLLGGAMLLPFYAGRQPFCAAPAACAGFFYLVAICASGVL